MARKLNNPNTPPEPPAPPPPPPPPVQVSTPPPMAKLPAGTPEVQGKSYSQSFEIKDMGAVSIRVLSTVVFANDGRRNWRLPRSAKKPVRITLTLQ